MRTVFILILISFCSKLVFADEQRLRTLFRSENGKYTLQYSKKKWKLKTEKGKLLYSIDDKGYTSMTIFVSNDGQRLVIIDDLMEGHQIGQRPALQFYNHTQLTASYKLTDLITDTCNVMKTVWHTVWSLSDFGINQIDDTFSLATFEFDEFECDVLNGEMLKKEKPAPFGENTLVVHGQFQKQQADEVTMSVTKYVVGPKQPNNQITFRTRSFGNGTWKETLMIKDGVDVTPERFRARMIGFSCF